MHMDELIERLEKATGPDRELDAAIALAIGIPATKSYGDEALGNFYRAPAYFKHYTASIDAAFTLVPEGCTAVFHLFNHRDGFWECDLGNTGADFCGQAATPALAICIAALRARGEA
jgi:hypothetical protein